MSRKSTRKGTPTKRAIRKYWTETKEGQEHIKRIRDSYSIEIENLIYLEYDMYTCFACNKPTSRVERCHIIPHANGGTMEPSNFVLMCPTCHKESPTINNEKIFWTWLDSVDDYFTSRLNTIRECIPSDLQNSDALPTAQDVIAMLNSYDVPLVGGKLSDSTLAGVLSESLEQATSNK